MPGFRMYGRRTGTVGGLRRGVGKAGRADAVGVGANDRTEAARRCTLIGMSGLLQDVHVQQAVSRVQQRAERQQLIDRLAETFVDPGITVQLDNTNHQILYGRRGTGKTHVLKVLQSAAEAMDDEVAIYVDMRVLGSSQIYEDVSRPYDLRVTSLLTGVLEAVRIGLIEHATAPQSGASAAVLDKLADFEGAVHRTIVVANSLKERSDESSRDSTDAGMKAGLSGTGLPSFGADLRHSSVAEQKSSVEIEGSRIASVNFQEVGRTLVDVVQGLGLRQLTILLDEWTAVPLDLQPLLAEFLKRAVMPHPVLTVKIASIEYRSNFNREAELNNVIGFEMGPDISSVLELDDYYVYDRNPDSVAGTFGELLYRHIRAETEARAGADVLDASYRVKDSEGFRRRMFASPDAFNELVRAGEGVSRDFISIFSTAFFNSLRRGRESVDLQAVREAAREYYEKDKSSNIDPVQATVLRRITTEVIGEKRARSFMLEKALEGHDVIRSLFDLRIIHLVRRGYADKDNPGLRYNIYTLDYGSYVGLARVLQ
jgi:hypothetical protein